MSWRACGARRLTAACCSEALKAFIFNKPVLTDATSGDGACLVGGELLL